MTKRSGCERLAWRREGLGPLAGGKTPPDCSSRIAPSTDVSSQYACHRTKRPSHGRRIDRKLAKELPGLSGQPMFARQQCQRRRAVIGVRVSHDAHPQAERLGWTKLSVLAQQAKADPDLAGRMHELVEMAEAATAHSLSRDGDDGGAADDRALLFRQSPAQYAIVAEALVKCDAASRGKRGLLAKEKALVEMAKRVARLPTARVWGEALQT